MPSPRSSPSMRPTSASRFEPSRLESMVQSNSPRASAARVASGGRNTNPSLKLGSLPRYHPSKYHSPSHSNQGTPHGFEHLGAPLSPRSHQRTISDAQRQLFAFQRDAVASARANSPLDEKPEGPRLVPLCGSPGPVTPLELEAEMEYLSAGIKRSNINTTASQQELVETLIQEEVRRTSRPQHLPTRLPRGKS
ncbi:hypothetical protein MRB53_037861 [Persea americana]|nr:hypothetical protein MRB53_037861 [Persea americana]